MQEILKEFYPQVHPLKATFRRCSIPQIVIARYLSVSQPQLSQWLGGYRPIPPLIEMKLEKLAALLAAQAPTEE